MNLDMNISIGVLGLIVTVLGVYFHMAYKLGKLEQKLNIMYTWFEKNVFGQIPGSSQRIRKFFSNEEDDTKDENS